MQIVTDSGTDMNLSAQEAAELRVHTVPLNVTLDGMTYQEGIDIEPEEFYQLLEKSENLPVTSQPSAGQFADLYRKLAAEDDNNGSDPGGNHPRGDNNQVLHFR